MSRNEKLLVGLGFAFLLFMVLWNNITLGYLGVVDDEIIVTLRMIVDNW